MTKEELKDFLIEEGWHISDGVDSCSGSDEKEQEESVNRLYNLLKEVKS